MGNDGLWSTFIVRVGQPPQALNVLASTQIPETWIISPDGCVTDIDAANCTKARGGVFRSLESSTYDGKRVFSLEAEKNLGMKGKYHNGRYFFDTLQIGQTGKDGVSVDRQLVAELAVKDFFLGNIGLASRPRFLDDETQGMGLLTSLQTEDLIPSLSYGLTAGASYRESWG